MTLGCPARLEPESGRAGGDPSRPVRATDPTGLVNLLGRSNPSFPRGLALGWKLAIGTALAVSLVLGSVTMLQERNDVRREWRDRQAWLTDSLKPLAARLEQAADLQEMRQLVRAEGRAYLSHDVPDIALRLTDSGGLPVVAVGERSRPPDQVMRASVPVESPLLDGGHGTLVLERDATGITGLAELLWHERLLDIALAALAVMAALLVLNTVLITRPLELLIQDVRRMERGYRDQRSLHHGPTEFRKLARHFQDVVDQLERTMSALLAAERRTSQASEGTGVGAVRQPPLADDEGSSDGWTDAAGATRSWTPGIDSRSVAADENSLGELVRLEERFAAMIAADPADPETQLRARQAWDVDAAAAEKLGRHDLQSRIETAAMRILEPDISRRLERELEAQKKACRKPFREQEEGLHSALEANSVPYLQIQSRIKSLPSVWRKMNSKHLALTDVQDLFGFRIIVSGEPDVYRALQAIHRDYRPRILRFKDYLKQPKVSGYRALHTTVEAEDGFCFEIQIRSLAMHALAESGPSAHWAYNRQQRIIASRGIETPQTLQARAHKAIQFLARIVRGICRRRAA